MMGNTPLDGFSSRAGNAGLLPEIKKQRKKTVIKRLIGMVVYLALVILSVYIVTVVDNIPGSVSAVLTWMSIVAFAAIPVFGILFFIYVFLFFGALRNLKKAGKAVLDGAEGKKEQKQLH